MGVFVLRWFHKSSSLILAALLIVFAVAMPFQAFAGDTDDVTVAVGSEENDPDLPNQLVGDGTQTYAAAPIPTSPGQQAEPTLAQIP